MKIHTISHEEIDEFLSRVSLGHIACESEGQPYIANAYLSAHRGFLYGFSALGQKIRWMRANPRVCVQFEELRSAREWTTVVVEGVYEELANTTEHHELRNLAHALLQRRAMWWEPATVSPDFLESADAAEPVYFRIRMKRKTGRRGAPEGHEFARKNWMHRIFHAR